MVTPRLKKQQSELIKELENFEDIALGILPPLGEIPVMKNIDIYGNMLPCNGKIGGDHIVYIDFKSRYDLKRRIAYAQNKGLIDIENNMKMNQNRAGVLIADVSGHSETDAFLAGRLHDAFLTGVLYELNYHGQVTPQLFEILNTRFYNSSSVERFMTMIYGEISEEGKFRFLSAGAPLPLIFSHKYDKFFEISSDRFTLFPPLGMYPSEADVDKDKVYSLLGYKEQYTVNEINLLGEGDILLLYTDGLEDHERDNEEYFPAVLEESLRNCKNEKAEVIWNRLRDDLLSFNSEQIDDISFIIIKKCF